MNKKIKIYIIFIILATLCGCHQLISIKNIEKTTTKTVFFIITPGHLGGSKGFFSLWQEMKTAGHNVKVVVLPAYYKGKKLYDIDDKFVKFFKPEEIILPCSQNKCSSIDKYKPDYIFVFNPYSKESKGSITENYTHINLSKIAKVMYIVYGPSLFHQAGLYDKTLPQTIDTIFVDSESTKDLYVEHYGFKPNKVIVSGYQGYKEMRDMKPDPHSKITILWMPRWVLSFVGRNSFESGSTFLNYYHFFYNFAKENKNVNLIIRPHENMERLAFSDKFLSKKDWNIIFNNFKKLPNVIISDHSTQQLVDNIIISDVVIADGTSALAEAVIADKPIIYLSNGLNLEFESNKLSKAFKPLIYFAYSSHNILSFLDILKKDNMQMFGKTICLANETEEHIPSYYFNYHKKDILDVCKVGYNNKMQKFKQFMDSVNNPSEFIANYLLNL